MGDLLWPHPRLVDHQPAAAPRRADPKKKTLIAREQDAEARAAWQAAWTGLDPERFVFVDETATPTTLTPTMGRAPRGQRVLGRVPRGHRPQISWLATLTRQGIGPSLVVDGAVDRDVFETFV